MAFDIHHFGTVTSTQDEISRLVAAGAQPGTVVIADHQSNGRGRQGRAWETPVGNLAATLYWGLQPNERPGDYSFIVATAMHNAITKRIRMPDHLRIKWPNDLMLRGKKCAGILLESPQSSQIFIGTGVNIVHAPEDRALLASEFTMPCSARDLLNDYLSAFEQMVALYREQGLAPIRTYWMDHAYGIGETMTIRLPTHEFTAIFDGLDETGACIAILPDGTRQRVHAGDVFFPTPK